MKCSASFSPCAIVALALLFASTFMDGGCTVEAIKDKATGITFADEVNGLNVFGVGVRKKGPIKVYAVGCYGDNEAKESLSGLEGKEAEKALLTSAEEGPTTFLLKFNFKVGAEKVSSSITDAIKPRFSGPADDVDKLKDILCKGVNGNGGSTVKGTTMQFDCSADGVRVSLDGKNLGNVEGGGLSKAFAGVYLDEKAVSPTLRQNCIENCCETE